MLVVCCACLLAGCDDGGRSGTTTAGAPTRTLPAGPHVLVVGPLRLQVAGATIEHGSLAAVSDQKLVVVSASAPAAASLEEAAVAHPETQFALDGGSARALRLPNVAGVVIRHAQAARLGGAVAGLAAAEESGRDARVAWVGPKELPLSAAFVRGVHEAAPGATILRAWSAERPAACKEAALAAIARGATVVMARGGECAAAAVAGARQQNRPGLRLADFELPRVAAAQVVRDALAGVYHGGEDVVFGASSGAVAIRTLDPRIPAAVAARARAAAGQLASGLRPSG
jgi:basic membrane lipoprotein Med (substrate-binding protein (PBP1-ABC) superfamily)